MRTIYDLELNQSLEVEGTNIIRVPGGWIYTIKDKQPIFIKKTDEFKDKAKKLDVKEVIRVIEGYFNLPKPIVSNPSIKEGNYPIAKQMICTILNDYANIDKVTIARILKYAGGTSVSASCRKLKNDLDVSSHIRKQYSDIKIKLKIL